jgi:Zn-dependent protease with chaperone function
VPAVYLLDDEVAINAFAAGLTSHDAVVAVTRGTLEKLTRMPMRINQILNTVYRNFP